MRTGTIEVGERVYYLGLRQKFDCGDELDFGAAGEVVQTSCGDGKPSKRIGVAFDKCQSITEVPIAQISRTRPSLPGDLEVGEPVYYCGGTRRFPDGDKLNFGLVGEVVGRPVRDSHEDARVVVAFKGNKNMTNVFVSSLSREMPSLPGNYRIGDTVFFCAESEDFGDGEKLTFTQKGTITGRATQGDASDECQVEVHFDGNSRGVLVFVSSISTEKPLSPGGYEPGDVVYFNGEKQQLGNGNMLEFGLRGKVLMRRTGVDAQRVEVLFEGNREGTVVLPHWVSRQKPVIPGGFALGDFVYYCGGRQTFASGNRLEFGLCGEVVGRSVTGAASDEKRLKVQFEGNSNGMDVGLTQISRRKPVIPGGYNVYDVVYFCGESEVFTNGDKLFFGLEGEVTGRSTSGDPGDDRRLKVLFNGNQGAINVFLSQISATAPVIPGGYKVDDVVYYSGDSQTFNNGDRLSPGLRGEVKGRSTLGDGTDEQRVKVRFDGNRGVINVYLTEISRHAGRGY